MEAGVNPALCLSNRDIYEGIMFDTATGPSVREGDPVRFG